MTCADKARVAEGLKKRGVKYGRNFFEYRTAARVLGEHEIEQVQQDIQLEIATEQADLAGDEDKAISLASKAVLRQWMGKDGPTEHESQEVEGKLDGNAN